MTTSRLESMQRRQDRVFRAGVDDTILTGSFMVDGVGDFRKTIEFPILFTGKPFPLFSAEMVDAVFPTHGDIPRLESAVVVEWRSPSGALENGSFEEIRYNGCTVALEITGAQDQLRINYRFEGLAFANPATENIDDLDAPL